MAKKVRSSSRGSIKGIYSGTKVSFLFMILAIVTGVIGVMSIKGNGIVEAINYAIAIVGVALILFSADFMNIKQVYRIIIQLCSLALGIVLICISFGWIDINFSVISLIFGILILIYSIFMFYISIKKKNANVYLVVASFVAALLIWVAGILYCCMYNNSDTKNLSIAAGVLLIIAAVIIRYNPIYRVKR